MPIEKEEKKSKLKLQHDKFENAKGRLLVVLWSMAELAY